MTSFIDFRSGESNLPTSTARRVASLLMPPIGGDLRRYIRRQYGELSAGEHEEGQGACILEAAAEWRGLGWTDNPETLGVPDIRPLNDAPWSDDAARTEAMVRVYETVADWAEWPASRRLRFAERVALRTAQDIVSEALWGGGLEVEAAWLAAASNLSQVAARADAAKRRAYGMYPRCGHAVDAIGHAARAARAASAPDAGTCAAEAARAVFYSARAVPDSAAVGLLQTAVAIWVEAARP